jgi:1-acyl-sn-glycerol-3-phosphate acyltransferase
MIKPAVRYAKGAYMFLMFAVFEIGILSVFIFAVPLITIYNALGGRDKSLMQRINRFLFGLWLKLLDTGGLFKAVKTKGSIVDGPCVVVANHPGLFDVLVMVRDIPGLSLLAKQSLAALPGLSKIFAHAGFIFASGNDDLSAAVQLTNNIVDILKSGRRFMLFPEGTRSPKGELLKFRSGAFKIARAAGVPIQPVLIKNIPPFMPKEDKWYYPPYEKSCFEAEFLDPIAPPEAGSEVQAAKELEMMFREHLGLAPDNRPANKSCSGAVYDK